MKTDTKYQLDEHVYCYLDGDIFEGKISNISERWNIQNPNDNGIKYTVNGKEVKEEFVFRTREELEESNIIPDGMLGLKSV